MIQKQYLIHDEECRNYLEIFQTRAQKSQYLWPSSQKLLTFSTIVLLSKIWFYRFLRLIYYHYLISSERIILIKQMSSSLPRIKTVQQIGQVQRSESTKQMKFRRLTVGQNENGEEEKIIKSNRDRLQSLHSLDKYSTVQEQRMVRNQKIHLNLIERKLLKGTYDQSNETSNQLNGLKQKRDKIKAQILLRQKQIQKITRFLNQVRVQRKQLEQIKSENEGKVKSSEQRLDQQAYKTQLAIDEKGVLQHMILARQNINLSLAKNQNQLKSILNHLKAAESLIDNELRQTTQKCSLQQTRFFKTLEETNRQHKEREDAVVKKQQMILKRKQGEAIVSQKSKQYVNQLQNHDRMTQIKQFKQFYNPILANLFISRLCKINLIELRQKYQPYEVAYKAICLYKTFSQEQPQTMVERFMKHPVQIIESRQTISERQQYINRLQQKRAQLKAKYQNITIQLNEAEQLVEKKFEKISHEQKHQIQNLENESLKITQRSHQVKLFILQLLKTVGQKGQKKLSNIASVKNMELLSAFIKEILQNE